MPMARLGGASLGAWLTCTLAIGDSIRLPLLADQASLAISRLGDNAARPLILIGNGTGICRAAQPLFARAKRRARATTGCCSASGMRRTTFFFATEIEAWRDPTACCNGSTWFSRAILGERH